MQALAIALFVIVAAGGLALAKRAADTSALAGRCREIERALSDPNLPTATRETMLAQLAECARDLAASGIAFDPLDAMIAAADSTGAAIDREWGSYKSVDFADAVQRNNKRNNIRSLSGTLAQQLRAIARAADTDIARDRARRAIERAIVASLTRAQCYAAGGACSRLGLNEPDWDEKMLDEITNGALAFGLRAAIESGWRSPANRTGAAAWAPYTRASASGNVPPPGLYTVGELARLNDPSWDDFGGGPHYAGQAVPARAAWDSIIDTPYAIVRRLDIGRALSTLRSLGTSLGGGPFRLEG